MQNPALRQKLADMAQQTVASGLNQGSSGNLSVRVDNGFLITPSALSADKITADKIVFMNAQGVPEGTIKPSSEWRFHHDIYQQRPEAGAVLHAHSTWCTTLACLHEEIPAFHYMIAIAGGENIRCAPYATFGTQALSDAALKALENRKACLLANHGLLCLDENLEAVFELAQEVESLARIYTQVLQTGKPQILSDDAMQVVLEKFSIYKQDMP